MFTTITFDPLLPVAILAVGGAVVLALLLFAAARRLSGWALRFLAAAVILAALANLSLREEERAPLTDTAFLVIDDSESQTIAPRPDQSGEAEALITAALEALGIEEGAPLDLRVVRTVPDPEDRDAGTRLLTALQTAAAEVPTERIAGAILVTDGRIHDAAALEAFPAPVHVLLTGEEDEWDRRLIVETAPAFGIVGETVPLSIRVEEEGSVPRDIPATMPLTVSLDGERVATVNVPVGESVGFAVPINRGGQNVLELQIPGAEGEVTERNNAALVSVNGVRDRLRVLLVSGEPHPGGRTWRNLLKSDPAVDLVHFTILRPPNKQDGVPVFEMSLIAFPTRELFMEKIDEFDLIIFDRYRRRGVLPVPYLANVVRYVEEGGAVLVASGPAFAGVESLYRTPLADILPARPSARVIEEGFLPTVSALGFRHPVTADLVSEAPRPVDGEGNPGWGRWFRQVELIEVEGDTVMEGAGGAPLLVLDRPGEGRIAMLASDHAWLWSRGYEGGGPQLELLRRLAHWLMREPELEEEILTAGTLPDGLRIERRSLDSFSGAVTVTAPDGTEAEITLTEDGQGRWTGLAPLSGDGLYRLSDGDLSHVVAVGPIAPIEFEAPLSTADLLEPLASATGGTVMRLADGVPNVRLVDEGRRAWGRGWIGVEDRQAFRVEDITLTPMAPAWLVLLLVAGLTLGAWRIEGR
ncbi:MAG: hypothetical protein ACPGID_04380 [Rubricella sp.]